MISTVAIWSEETEWITGIPAQILCQNSRIVSLVGGGGKTTLLHHLARYSACHEKRCTVLTTTKMHLPLRLCRTAEDIENTWAKKQYAVCGCPLPSGKMGPPSQELLDWVIAHSDQVYIEADGSRRLPCKMPAAHEPVILPESDSVIAVAGLDALGKAVGSTCHRPELVCDFLGCQPDHLLTCTDLARILFSPKGGRKNAENRPYAVVLNKCDTPERLESGKTIAKLLQQLGCKQVVLTHFSEEERT